MRDPRSGLAAIAIAGLVSIPIDALSADKATSVPSNIPSEGVVGSNWEIQTTLYLWATALEGSLGNGNLPNASLDISFSDILKNLDGAVMADLYVKHGNWMFLGDIVWANISDKATLNVANSPTLKYDQQLLILSAIGGYQLPLNIDRLDLSATAGVRYQQLSSETTLQSGTFAISTKRDSTHAWLDPILGLALQYDINDRWRINGLTDVGGFGVGSQLTAQGFLAASYDWSDRVSTAFGYRAIYTNYESGLGANRFDYEGTLHGPFMSLGVSF
jgi:hypothetical protein